MTCITLKHIILMKYVMRKYVIYYQSLHLTNDYSHKKRRKQKREILTANGLTSPGLAKGLISFPLIVIVN